MKKTVQNIFKYIVIIPLVYIVVNNFQIYGFMKLFYFLYLFLFYFVITFLLLLLFQFVYIPVLTLIFGDKIDFTIKRLFYIAIILSIFITCLLETLFPLTFSLC